MVGASHFQKVFFQCGGGVGGDQARILNSLPWISAKHLLLDMQHLPDWDTALYRCPLQQNSE